MAVTELSVLDRAVQSFYDPVLVDKGRENLTYARFGLRKNLPSRQETEIRFRKIAKLSNKTTPLTEGVTPSSDTPALSELNVSVLQYGGYITFSDDVELHSVDPVLAEQAVEQGFQAGNTLDVLTRDVIVAGTNVKFANGSARTDINTIIAIEDFQSTTRTLDNNNASTFTERIPATDGVGTTPIDRSFWAITHPDISLTIRKLTGFESTKNYPSHMSIEMGEIGSIDNGRIRVIETTNAKIFSGGGTSGGTNVKEDGSNDADVYVTLVIARNAYGVVDVDGNSMEQIIHPKGSAGAADPLNQRGSQGWKSKHAAIILNDDFMVRIESAATDTL